jgi:UrcA family protein
LPFQRPRILDSGPRWAFIKESVMKSVNAGSATSVLALALVLSPGAAFAAGSFSQGDQRSVTVRYADFNLAGPEGTAKRYRRIRAAADLLCAPRVPPGTLWESPSYRRCFNSAVEEGVAQVHRPALTALHEQQRARGERGAG